MKTASFFSIVFFLCIIGVINIEACSASSNDSTSEEDFNKLTKCTAWRCQNLVSTTYQKCWQEAHDSAIKQKKEKNAKLKAAASGAKANQPSNTKEEAENKNISLTEEEKKQVMAQATNKLKIELARERCEHKPCSIDGFRVGI